MFFGIAKRSILGADGVPFGEDRLHAQITGGMRAAGGKGRVGYLYYNLLQFTKSRPCQS